MTCAIISTKKVWLKCYVVTLKSHVLVPSKHMPWGRLEFVYVQNQHVKSYVDRMSRNDANYMYYICQNKSSQPGLILALLVETLS